MNDIPEVAQFKKIHIPLIKKLYPKFILNTEGSHFKHDNLEGLIYPSHWSKTAKKPKWRSIEEPFEPTNAK